MFSVKMQFYYDIMLLEVIMESVDNLKERFNGLTEGIFEPEELECLKKEVNLKTITGRYSVIRNLYARLDNPAISEENT